MPDLIDLLLQAAALVLLPAGTAGATWLGARIARSLRLADDQRIRAYLTEGLNLAVEYGLTEARRRLRGGDSFVTSEVRAEREHDVATRIAADYAQQHWPDALRHFQVTPEGLNTMIRARLPGPRPLVGG